MNAKHVGLALAGIGAAIFLATAPKPEGASRAALIHQCSQVGREAKKYAARYGQRADTDGLADACVEALDHKPRLIPDTPPEPMTPSPGCDALEPPKPLPRRTVAAPSKPIPYFAPKTGRLPADGPAVVGGVAVPRGSRCPGFWATDDDVAAPFALAAKLAAQFPRTGLWPMIWDHEGEAPDFLNSRITDPAEAEGIDVLGALSRDVPEVTRLAPGSSRVARAGADPFAGLPAIFRPSPAVVMLVPVNRPADVLALLGGMIDTEYYTDAQLTAVARSWEERFGAVPTAIGQGGLFMQALAPPRDRDAASALAHELRAFAPDEPEPEAELTPSILRGEPWGFGWMD